ncbi:hypothetical protein AAY473_040152 [Plecturocebus cupreus]
MPSEHVHCGQRSRSMSSYQVSKRQGLTLLPRLECCGIGSSYVVQAGLELLASSDPPTLACLSSTFLRLTFLRKFLFLHWFLFQHLQSPDCKLCKDWEIPGRGATWVASATLRRRGCFASAPVRCFLVRSIRDRRARLVPSPQGKQQSEALRTEFHSKHSEPGKVRLCGEQASAKGKLRNRKNFITGWREIQDGHVAAAQDCSSQ